MYPAWCRRPSIEWASGLVVFGLLVGLSVGFDRLLFYLGSRGPDFAPSFWIYLGMILVFDLAAIGGFAVLHRIIRTPKWLGGLLAAAGAFVWFLSFCQVQPFMVIGSWANGLIPWANHILLGHPSTALLFAFYLFAGVALLLRRQRDEPLHGFAESYPLITSTFWLLVLVAASFLTTALSPVSLVSSSGIFGTIRPRWIAQNIGDTRAFILDLIVVLSWLAVARASIRRWRSVLPWIGCGVALLVLAILPEVITSSSFAFRQFFSRVTFWFGSTADMAGSTLAISILSTVLHLRHRTSQPSSPDELRDSAS